MQSVDLSNVPSFIKNGSLFQVLSEGKQPPSLTPGSGIDGDNDDNDGNEDNSSNKNTILSFPVDYCQFDLSNLHQFKHMSALLATLRYWGVSEIPAELMMYLLEAPMSPETMSVLAEEHREGDSFAFLVDLPNLRSIKEAEIHMEYAAKLGNVALMSALHKYHCNENSWNMDVFYYVASGGHLDCLKYAHEHGCPWFTIVCTGAARGGHLECLRYAHEHGCPWGAETCNSAAKAGHLNCLLFSLEHGCPWDLRTSYYATESGHLDCLQYLHEHGCPWSAGTCSTAAIAGRLDCLQYLHEHGCPWDTNTCYFAAASGHLDCLQYLHEHGCEWAANTCYSAAKGGNLDCLQYAHEHGCSLTREACYVAAEWGHLDCLRYFVEHGFLRELKGLVRTVNRYKHAHCAAYLNSIPHPSPLMQLRSQKRHLNG
jgi:hypothetical protein